MFFLGRFLIRTFYRYIPIGLVSIFPISHLYFPGFPLITHILIDPILNLSKPDTQSL